MSDNPFVRKSLVGGKWVKATEAGKEALRGQGRWSRRYAKPKGIAVRNLDAKQPYRRVNRKYGPPQTADDAAKHATLDPEELKNTLGYAGRVGGKNTGKSYVWINPKTSGAQRAMVVRHEAAHAEVKRPGNRTMGFDSVQRGREEGRADYLATGHYGDNAKTLTAYQHRAKNDSNSEFSQGYREVQDRMKANGTKVRKSYVNGKFVRAVDLTGKQAKKIRSGGQFGQSRGANGNRRDKTLSSYRGLIEEAGPMRAAMTAGKKKSMERMARDNNWGAFTMRVGGPSSGKSHVFVRNKKSLRESFISPKMADRHGAIIPTHEAAHANPKRSEYRLHGQIGQNRAKHGREEGRADFLAGGHYRGKTFKPNKMGEAPTGYAQKVQLFDKPDMKAALKLGVSRKKTRAAMNEYGLLEGVSEAEAKGMINTSVKANRDEAAWVGGYRGVHNRMRAAGTKVQKSDGTRRMVRDRTGKYMGAIEPAPLMIQTDIPLDASEVSKARATNKEIEANDPNAWRTIKQSESLAAGQRRKKGEAQGSAFIAGGSALLGLGTRSGMTSTTRLVNGVAQDHRNLKYFAANGDAKGARKAMGFARGIGRSAKFRAVRSPLGVGILGAGTGALALNGKAGYHQAKADEHQVRANDRRKAYHASRKVSKADKRGVQREVNDRLQLGTGIGAAGLGGFMAANGRSEYKQGKRLWDTGVKAEQTMKGTPFEAMSSKIGGSAKNLGAPFMRSGKKGMLTGAGVGAAGLAMGAASGRRLHKYSDKRVSKMFETNVPLGMVVKGMPDMADVHVQGVLRPVRRVTKDKVSKAFGNQRPDNPFAAGISGKERGKRAGKNTAVAVPGTAGAIGGFAGGVKAFNHLGGGRKGLAAGVGTLAAGSGAGMYGSKKLGDKLYPGSKAGVFSRKPR